MLWVNSEACPDYGSWVNIFILVNMTNIYIAIHTVFTK